MRLLTNLRHEIGDAFLISSNNELYITVQLPAEGISTEINTAPNNGIEPTSYKVRIIPISGSGAGLRHVLNMISKKVT